MKLHFKRGYQNQIDSPQILLFFMPCFQNFNHILETFAFGL
jgi:hypothetical protein